MQKTASSRLEGGAAEAHRNLDVGLWLAFNCFIEKWTQSYALSSIFRMTLGSVLVAVGEVGVVWGLAKRAAPQAAANTVIVAYRFKFFLGVAARRDMLTRSV